MIFRCMLGVKKKDRMRTFITERGEIFLGGAGNSREEKIIKEHYKFNFGYIRFYKSGNKVEIHRSWLNSSDTNEQGRSVQSHVLRPYITKQGSAD